MQHIVKSLTVFYYIQFPVILAVAGVGILLQRQGIAIEHAGAKTTLESLVILYVIASMPLALKLFSAGVRKLRADTDITRRHARYVSYARWRIVAIAFGIDISILGFYLLPEFHLIYLAAIGALAMIFCKPTHKRIEADLSN
ncbi:MAG: hypothetical protein LBS16_06190 [Prevotellaceae bacterium]|jgi:hypothetical protein|nr:hypothetical protein [Prevotellaceae bacterium]